MNLIERLRCFVRGTARAAKLPSGDGSAPVKLNLGCGGDRRPGYLNVDNAPASRPDILLDLRDLAKRFATGSVAEAVMIHSLGYLTLWEARKLFEDLRLLLVPGGRLVLELPDAAKCAARLLEAVDKNPAVTDDYLEAVRGLYAFGREHIEGGLAYTPYVFGWSGRALARALEDAGFTNVRITDPLHHGKRLWRDVRVEAQNPGATPGEPRP